MRQSLLDGTHSDGSSQPPQSSPMTSTAFSWSDSRTSRSCSIFLFVVLPFILLGLALAGATVATGLACAAISDDGWTSGASIAHGVAGVFVSGACLVSAIIQRFQHYSHSKPWPLTLVSLAAIPKSILGSLFWLFYARPDRFPPGERVLLEFGLVIITELIPLAFISIAYLLIRDICFCRHSSSSSHAPSVTDPLMNS